MAHVEDDIPIGLCLKTYNTICKRLWSPGIDSEESISQAYVTGGPVRQIGFCTGQAENRYLVSIKDLKIRALSPVFEIIDPVFAKTSPNRSFFMTKYERFGLVFTKTRVYKFGH